ncbi:MAG: hypothetical protein JWQ09_567, partial [Segetibacter sp.]|nr:hypothetical protein [Segetibacter sp.]
LRRTLVLIAVYSSKESRRYEEQKALVKVSVVMVQNL